MPSTVHRRSVPSRTTRSAACASTRSSSDRSSFSRKRRRSANAELRAVDPPIAAAIVRACDPDPARRSEIQRPVRRRRLSGRSGNFVQHELQRGHRQLIGERVARRKDGEYKPVHPNDHVNMSQWTNDVFPTAIRMATADAPGRGWRRSSMRLPLPFTPRATSSPTSSSPAAPTCRMRMP